MATAQNRPEGRRKVLLLAGGAVGFLVLAGVGVWSLMGSSDKPPPKPPKLTLISPPPPPPPPPKEEKKPDPPKEQKEIKVEQPQPKPEAPAPSPELKMEGAAGDGPSAFASGKVTSDDVSNLGKGDGKGGGSGMFDPFNNYANALKGELQRYLRKNKELRQRQYTVEVVLWVSGSGELKRSELEGSTGDNELDAAIRQAMAGLPGFGQKPPADMPQPIRLRIMMKS